jgi:hypothetical protein
LSGERRQGAIEAADMHPLHRAIGQQFKLLAQTREPRRRRVRGKQFARMRLEGQHHRWQGPLARPFGKLREQSAMTAMDAVEIANRQYRRRGRVLGDSAKDLHGMGK